MIKRKSHPKSLKGYIFALFFLPFPNKVYCYCLFICNDVLHAWRIMWHVFLIWYNLYNFPRKFFFFWSEKLNYYGNNLQGHARKLPKFVWKIRKNGNFVLRQVNNLGEVITVYLGKFFLVAIWCVLNIMN